MEELKAKADDTEQRHDFAIASGIHYYALSDLQQKLVSLKSKKREREDDAAAGGGNDTVMPEQIAEIVAHWTSILVTRLLLTGKEKLLRMESILSEEVIGQPEAVKAIANTI